MAESARILLVAGDARTAEFVAKGLGLDGHEVVVAEDAEVGLFLATTERYEVIVLDASLESDGGPGVFDGTLGVPDGVPVIILSERDDPDARRAWADAGAVAFLARPLDLPTLRARVNEQLAQPRA